MKKTPIEILNQRKIELPSKGFSRILRFILKLMQTKSDVSYKYSFEKNDMEGKQVILLADHATREAYKYVLYGYPFVTPNTVIGYQNIFIKGLFKPLLKAGIIPKKLYQADPRAILDMLKVLSLGGSLCLFPEGIQSASGSTHPIFKGTAQFLKKAGVTVVLCKSYGAYLVKPRYKKNENRGHQEFHYEILFTEEDLADMSVEEIYDKLLERFKYNDFEWNKTARNKYKGTKKHPLAEGVTSILYHCPKCGSEFKMKTEGNDIICENCGNTVTLNEYYDFVPKNADTYMPFSSIDEWFKYQRHLVGEEVKQDFCYEYDCYMYDQHRDKLSNPSYYICGEGAITITKDGIRYIGTRHNEEVDIFFEMKNAPSFVLTSNLGNELFYNNVFYSFTPKVGKEKSVKYMLLTEESNRLFDEDWNKVSEDVYC